MKNVRNILVDAKFEKSFAEAVHIAVYLKNRAPVAGFHLLTLPKLNYGLLENRKSATFEYVPKEKLVK